MKDGKNLHNGEYRVYPTRDVPRHGHKPGLILNTQTAEDATMTLKDAYTTQELAPLLGITTRAVLDRAKRESWQSRPRAGRGGGSEWLVASMPEATRSAIIFAVASETQSEEAFDPAKSTALAPVAKCTSIAPVVSAQPSKEFAQFTTREREVALARKAFVIAVLNLEETGMSRNAAIAKLLKAAETGQLSTYLTEQIERANARSGSSGKRGLSRRRLYAWCTDYERDGEVGLVPDNPQPVMKAPVWLDIFLILWQRPQKPGVPQVHDEFLQLLKWLAAGCPERGLLLPPLPQAEEVAKHPRLQALLPMAQNPDLVPSISAVRRWIGKIGTIDRERGRMTGNELLRLMPHQQRTTYHFLPGDWYTADGTTLDAEIINPEDGKPMKAELVLIIDVETRLCVGASVGKAENALIVLNALRIACCAFGIPAALYSDNGPGYLNNTLGNAHEDGGKGILARVGITPKRAIPGRPRGKGLMERAVKTISDRISKALPSCTHADMDKDAAHNIYKLSRKQIKATGATTILPQWRATMELIGREIDAYNNRPHTGLPKFTDAKGKVRHYSPLEYWKSFVTQGFVPEIVPEGLRDTLFHPSVIRTVHNGEIKFAKHTYFSIELKQFHGDKVDIRYDEWDCTQISVWTLEGRKICVVDLNGNAVSYVGQAELEKQRRNRSLALREAVQAAGLPAGAQVALPEGGHSDETRTITVGDSLTGGKLTTYVPGQNEEIINANFRYIDPPAPDDEQDTASEERRPNFADSSDKYIYLMQNPDKWLPPDSEWVSRYVASDEYVDFYDYYETRGLEWREPCVSNL